MGLSGLPKVLRAKGKSERHSKELARLAVDNVAFNLFKCMGNCFHV